MNVAYESWTCAIKASDASNWSQHSTYASTMGWGNLKANTKYEYKVKRTCGYGSTSNWSTIKTFWTGSGSWSASRSREQLPIPIDYGTGLTPSLTNEQDASKLGIDLNVVSDFDIPEQSHISTFEVFPNPAHDIVNVTGVEIGDQLQLINLQGKLIVNESHNIQRLDVSNIPSGYYQLMIIKANGVIEKQKLIITH